MRWPEILFALSVVLLVGSLVAFGWGTLVVVLVAWLLGAALVAAVKYEIWRSQLKSIRANRSSRELDIMPAEDGTGFLLRLKQVGQVYITADEARLLHDHLDSVLPLSTMEPTRE